MQKFKEIHLASRPVGLPDRSNFKLVEIKAPKLADGEILVKNEFLTVDPYMRGRMNDVKSYVAPFQIDKVLEGGAVGEVLASKDAKFKPGMKVLSSYGWRDGWVASTKGVMALDTTIDAPLSAWLGALGMPGLTAWAGLLKAGELKEGDTVFVSGAAGAVGSLVGQIAKIKGCRVIGSAGSDEKISLLKDLGFDASINYKNENLLASLQLLAPEGIDVYFDNVGGSHLEAALQLMKVGGHIALCGAIENYNATDKPQGPSNLFLAIVKSLTLRGFIVSDYSSFQKEFAKDMNGWLKTGKVRAEETILQGIEKTPEAFLGLFSGKNKGKMIVKV